jgi:hypothetical protein
MRPVRVLALAFGLAACSTDLPHEAPYDALSPQDKQATASFTGRVHLEGETDDSQVALKLLNAAHTYTFETEAGGKVAATGIVPGAYALRVEARYFEPVTQRVSIEAGGAFDLGTLVLHPRSAAVAGSALAQTIFGKTLVTKGGVEVTLGRMATARQLGLKPQAAAATGATVAFTALSGTDGAYRFAAVPAGKYALTATRGDLPPATLGGIEVTGDEAVVEVADVLIKPATGYIDVVGSVRGLPHARFTQVSPVTLQLNGFNADKMRVGSAPGSDVSACVPGAAEAVAATVQVALPHEGPYVFCAVFLDAAGNASEAAYGGIVYDATPPVLPGVTLNGGAA